MRELVAAFDAMARAANTSYKTISQDSFSLYRDVILKVKNLDSEFHSLKRENDEAIANLASTVREVQSQLTSMFREVHGQVCTMMMAVGEAERRTQGEISRLSTKIDQMLSKMDDSFSQTARDSMVGRETLDQRLRHVEEDIRHGFRDNRDLFERLSAIHRRGEDDVWAVRKATLEIQRDAFDMRKIVSEAHEAVSDIQQEGRDLTAGFEKRLDQSEELTKSLLSVLTMRRHFVGLFAD
ncbi:hypothetical protein ESCO_006333 [Escovopsis weberi]|uniref:Uncharacterized protein n=1 Tax=Escovopsis weberi TaxID=150374 RepID=A0A0N0RTM0_ESCWE|nr:hypothetical protein ESCO_006333 [Escovopsis weberi]